MSIVILHDEQLGFRHVALFRGEADAHRVPLPTSLST